MKGCVTCSAVDNAYAAVCAACEAVVRVLVAANAAHDRGEHEEARA